MRQLSLLAILAIFALTLQAPAQFCQQVAIDDGNPATGTNNAFPWGQANGFTTIHFYTAAQLAAGGITAGSILTDIEVAPTSTGNYSAPQARLVVGHVPNAPVPTLWEANIVGGSVVHDLTDGPYAFPFTNAAWTRLPNVHRAQFAWDGVTDIAIFYTSSPGTTGTFTAKRTPGNLRHALNVFNATTQTPQSNGNFAMEVRLTFNTGTPEYQENTGTVSLTLDFLGASPCFPAIRTVATGGTTNLRLDSVNSTFGFGWDLAYTLPEPLLSLTGGAGTFPGITFGGLNVINVDTSAPSFALLNNLTLPPFAPLTLPLSGPTGLSASTQMLMIDPASPSGITLSGAGRVEFL